MKKLLFWMVLIVGLVALIGSCAKKDDDSSTTTATTATKPTTFVSTDTAASGSITVGSETMSGTYASACVTSVDTMIAGGYLPSDAKAWGGIVVVTGNDNLTQETVSYTDTSCTSVSHRIRTIYDNITVGSASGSNYPLTMDKAAQGFLVATTTAETWLEALFLNQISLTVGTESYGEYTGSTNPRYGLISLTSTTLTWADVDDNATEVSSDGALSMWKQ